MDRREFLTTLATVPFSNYTLASPEKGVSQFPKGVKRRLNTSNPVIALTFDACDGAYDQRLIDYLKKENIPSSLFLSGKWIDTHVKEVRQFAGEEMFEIENHGLHHKPLSMHGHGVYGIKGTTSIDEAIVEVEENAQKIFSLTGTKPKFYRSGTAHYEREAVKMIGKLGYTAVNFDIVSGDAINNMPKDRILQNMLRASEGSIMVMHMNRPQGNTLVALMEAVPRLKDRGYKFVHIKQYPLI